MVTAIAPIGVFDSGVGGLSVLQEIQKNLPHEDILYFADSGNCPYGPRSTTEICKLTERAVEELLSRGTKAIVIACNTASTAAVAYLRQKWPDVPFVGIVPAVKPAVALTKSGLIAVLSTEATGRAAALHDVITRFAADQQVLIVPAPGLVELVEAGQANSPKTYALLSQYLEPALQKGADVIVLGCTHFPFLRPTLTAVVGERVVLLDSGAAVARQTGRVLDNAGLLNPQNIVGKVRFFTTAAPDHTRKVVSQLLQLDPTQLDITALAAHSPTLV